ncbi:MAG: type II toxin-antitoxin system VapC family toxin [Cyanobacteria bacterium P01_C01_bin.72]
MDTCALLWWSLDPKEFSATASVAIEKMEQEKNGITPSMAIWEIAIKVKNKKLDLGVPLDTYVSKLKQSDVVKIMPVDEDILVKSVNLQWSHRDPVDRIIVALAMHNGYSIITKDSEIRKFYHRTIW